MNNQLTRLGFFFLWLFHWLPLGTQAAIGNSIGWLGYFFAQRRTQIAQRNLERCFPEKTPTEIRRLVRRNIQASVRTTLEHGLLIWASAKRLEKLVRLQDAHHLDSLAGQPVILLVPHFVSMMIGGTRLSINQHLSNMYRPSRNTVVDHYLLSARTRFIPAELVSSYDGIRPLIRHAKAGVRLHYSPDLNYGRRESIFVPFFGIPAATVPALSRLAKVSGAKVVPAITRQLPGGQGYVMQFYPAWENFPTSDIEADTRRMNAFIEARVREIPEQYLWTHRRFKTRPNKSDPGFYD